MKAETHFLIVDDYSNIRNLVKGQLNDFGFANVTERDNVDKGISFLETNTGKPVDFIISDWNMPGKTGLDFLKWVRSQEKFKKLPFLILTTENEQAKIMNAVAAGVSNFLLKPWETEDLASKIELCWKKHHG
ncbi:MAG: response regulator [Bacteriovoracaceae bacterium]|nr:response regulator [Bacteriovoracaceae bacterium]